MRRQMGVPRRQGAAPCQPTRLFANALMLPCSCRCPSWAVCHWISEYASWSSDLSTLGEPDVHMPRWIHMRPQKGLLAEKWERSSTYRSAPNRAHPCFLRNGAGCTSSESHHRAHSLACTFHSCASSCGIAAGSPQDACRWSSRICSRSSSALTGTAIATSSCPSSVSLPLMSGNGIPA